MRIPTPLSVVVDLDAVTHDIDCLKRMLPPRCEFLSVVKAGEFGQGLLQNAKEAADGGADWLGVANIEQAVELRSMDIVLPILVMGNTPPERVPELIANRLTQAISDLDYAYQLSEAARVHKKTLDVQVQLEPWLYVASMGSPAPRATST